MRYYARTQPERNVYLFDRLAKTMRFLGVAKDLAKTTGP